MPNKFKKYYPLFFIVPLVFIRLAIIQNSSLTFFSDDAVYAVFARAWHEHNFSHIFHPFWPPFYPFLSSLVFPLTLSWEIALRLVSLIASTALLAPVYFLTKTLSSKLTATLACVSVFLLSPIVHFSVFTFSDMLAACFIVSSLTTLYFALNRNENRLFVYSAILLGLTYLTRSEGTMFFGLSLIYVICYATIQKNLKIIPLFLITFAFVVSPYVISTHNQLGSWTLSQKFNAQIQQGQAFQIRNGTTWAQEIWSINNSNYNSKYWQKGPNFILNNFYNLQKSFVEKFNKWKALILSLFPIWFIALATIGLFSLKRQQLWGNLFLIYILFLTIPITIFSTSVIDIRYLLWVNPLIVIFFFVGAFRASSKLSHPLPVIIPFLLLVSTPAFSKESLNVKTYADNFTKLHYRPALIEASEFIKTHATSSEPKIFTRHEAIEFYSGGQTVYIPEGKYEDILNYANESKVDFFVAWNRELAQEKDLSSLVDPTSTHDRLKFEKSLSTPEGNLVIYSLK